MNPFIKKVKRKSPVLEAVEWDGSEQALKAIKEISKKLYSRHRDTLKIIDKLFFLTEVRLGYFVIKEKYGLIKSLTPDEFQENFDILNDQVKISEIDPQSDTPETPFG